LTNLYSTAHLKNRPTVVADETLAVLIPGLAFSPVVNCLVLILQFQVVGHRSNPTSEGKETLLHLIVKGGHIEPTTEPHRLMGFCLACGVWLLVSYLCPLVLDVGNDVAEDVANDRA
jgi:hypothetical protein